VLFEMLCGRPPFVHEGSGELIAAHLTEPPPIAGVFEPGVPVEVDEVLARLLRKGPNQRPQTMREVVSLLAALEAPAAEASELAPSAPDAPTAPATPHPSADTTLGVAASEQIEPDEVPVHSRARLWAAAALALVVVGGALALRRGEPPPARSVSAAAAQPASPQVPSLPPASQQPPAVAVPSAPPSASPAGGVRRVRVSLEVAPAGAEVCLASDRKRLGTTRAQIELPADGRKVTFLARLPGHRLGRVTLRVDRDLRRRVTLRPLGPDELESSDACLPP
jgi:serine/threonine-protein kinase